MIKISDKAIEYERGVMIKDWNMWVKKIEEAARKVLPDSIVKYNVREIKEASSSNDIGNHEISIIIESRSIPDEPFLKEHIVNEIIRLSEMPFYTPFKIILKKIE